jgi:hypothetical protein
MTDEQPRQDRHPTDEPDGTPAYVASLRPAGESVRPPAGRPDDADADADDFTGDDTGGDAGNPDSAFDGPVLPGESRAGYDVDDVSGDTDAVRPQ